MDFQIAYLERFPYFDGSNLLKLRKDALNEYYVMLVTAFLKSCKFLYETTDETIIEAIDSCVVMLNKGLASRSFSVQLLPIAPTLYKLFDCVNKKLLKAGLNNNAANLEELRRRIFLSWTRIS